MKTREEYLFEEAPVSRAVLSLVVPTVISQLITVIYNMADTFFIGQIGDPNQVAAVSLCMPMFIFLTGMANLFGIGGSSLMARSLGVGNVEKARKTAAFSIWTAAATAFVYGIILALSESVLLPVAGADAQTYEFCRKYLFWTIVVGAVPTVLNQTLAHLVRAEGHSAQASFGVALGGVLNIILDPIFIFPLGMEIAGAAVATMLSNVIATMYFIVFICFKGKGTDISFNPKNKLMAGYANTALAGIGVAKKIDMMTFAISTGMSQGVLPLIAYNYSAGNYKRMKAAFKVDFVLSFVVAIITSVLLFTCAGPIVQAFINDPQTVEYGRLFQRIICITGPCIAVTMLSITMFQAVGKKLEPGILSLLRKGGLDIPFMFLLNHLAGVKGIVWATPIADLGAMIVALSLIIPFLGRLKTKEETIENLSEK